MFSRIRFNPESLNGNLLKILRALVLMDAQTGTGKMTITFFPLYSSFKNCFKYAVRPNCTLWKFSHFGHQFLLCKFCKNLGEFIKNPQQVMFTRQNYICILHQALFLYFTDPNHCRISYPKTVSESWIPGAKKLASFSDLCFFMVKLSFKI